MEIKKCVVVGIQVTEQTSGKNEGKKYVHYFLKEPFSTYESENGNCIGMKTSKEFSMTEFSDIKVGDVVTPIYERMTFNNIERAVLVGFISHETKK